jgi:hypothetical protein
MRAQWRLWLLGGGDPICWKDREKSRAERSQRKLAGLFEGFATV